MIVELVVGSSAGCGFAQMDDRSMNAAPHLELDEVLPGEFKRRLAQPTSSVLPASARALMGPGGPVV